MPLFASQVIPGGKVNWSIGQRGAATQDLWPAKVMGPAYNAPGIGLAVDLVIQRQNLAGETYHDARTVAIRFCEPRSEDVEGLDDLDGKTLMEKVAESQALRRQALAAATSLEAVDVDPVVAP